MNHVVTISLSHTVSERRFETKQEAVVFARYAASVYTAAEINVSERPALRHSPKERLNQDLEE